MGLDMFLVTVKKGEKVDRNQTVVGYWRNAHRVLDMFQQYLQSANGSIVYQENYKVEKEELEALKNKCIGSLREKNVPSFKLIPRDEFMHGDVDREKWNIECLKQTIQIIDNILTGGIQDYGTWGDGDPIQQVDWDNQDVYFVAW